MSDWRRGPDCQGAPYCDCTRCQITGLRIKPNPIFEVTPPGYWYDKDGTGPHEHLHVSGVFKP